MSRPGQPPVLGRKPVTVVVPVYNDAVGLDACCACIAVQKSEASEIREVLLLDGGSEDRTREVALEWAQRDPRFRLVDNHDRYVSAALNRAVRLASTDTFIWISSHTTVAPDYVDVATATLLETGADVVGGTMRPVGTTRFGNAVAWALQSPWGVGGSPFHRDDYEGEADSAYMLVFTRQTIERFGAFDECCIRNQDDEFTYRVRGRGGRVWLTSRLRSQYTAEVTSLRSFGSSMDTATTSHVCCGRIRAGCAFVTWHHPLSRWPGAPYRWRAADPSSLCFQLPTQGHSGWSRCRAVLAAPPIASAPCW